MNCMFTALDLRAFLVINSILKVEVTYFIKLCESELQKLNIDQIKLADIIKKAYNKINVVY